MSILSGRPVPRRQPSVAATAVGGGPDAEPPTLADLATGQEGVVLTLDTAADPAGARRLFDLGFVPGAPVRMIRKAPLSDPTIFRVAGYEIALRREQARWVAVMVPQPEASA